MLNVIDIEQVDEMQKMLSSDGDCCDLGWFGPIDDVLIKEIKAFTSKPYCLISKWCWWDMDASEKEQAFLNSQSLKPAIVFSNYVLDDQLDRFREGDQCRSSLLINCKPPAFFETKNTVYVLIGGGTRKKVKPELAASLFW